MLENDEIDEDKGPTKRLYNRNNGNTDGEQLTKSILKVFV